MLFRARLADDLTAVVRIRHDDTDNLQLEIATGRRPELPATDTSRLSSGCRGRAGPR